MRADDDLRALVLEERRRVFARRFFFVAAGATAFSAFNVMRFARLSATGKTASIVSLTLSSLLTY